MGWIPTRGGWGKTHSDRRQTKRQAGISIYFGILFGWGVSGMVRGNAALVILAGAFFEEFRVYQNKRDNFQTSLCTVKVPFTTFFRVST